jgi:predicted MFS family arabinose efflux permease
MPHTSTFLQRSLAGRIHRAWWVALGAFLAITGAGAFSTMAGLLVHPLQHEFDWSQGSIGFAASVNMVLYGLTAPFAAALMDRVGIRRVVAAALVLLAIGAAATTAMTAAWQFVLYWGLLVGLGTGTLALTFAATVTNRWFVRHRGLAAGLLTSGSVLGQFLFLPVLGWIIESYQWRSAMVTLTLTAAVVAILAYLLLRDHPQDVGHDPYGAPWPTSRPTVAPGAARRTVRALCSAVRTGPFWLLAASFAVCGASTNGVMWTYFVPDAASHGMPMPVAASMLTLVGIFNVAGTVGSGWLTDRLDPRVLLAAYYALRGVSLIALPHLFGPTVGPLMIAFSVTFGILDLATVPPTIALCRRAYGSDGAIVFGWVNAAHQVGAAAIAFVGGVIRDNTGSYDLIWLVVGILCFVAAVIARIITVNPRERHGF